MRLRNIKGSRETIENNSFVIKTPEQYKGTWKELFQNENPIHIEIGMGKGKFITELANRYPNINYIGIEKFSSVLVRALEKRDLVEHNNLFYIRMDAQEIETIFEEGEIDRIYLNFSDPWPKDRHQKRRLTSKEFLTCYNSILRKDGEVIFKTDNRALFDFSVEQVPEANWQIKKITYDLHHSEYAENNIMTEYEEKFCSMGNPIYYMTIIR